MSYKRLVALDFDNTISAENTDLVALSLIPDDIERDNIYHRRKGGEWTALMNQVFETLFKCSISLAEVSTAISKISLIDGMHELFQYLRANKALHDVIILSDSNSWFIDIILKANNIDDVPVKIYTIAAEFINGKKLHIIPCHYHNHTPCPRNMCKGTLLKEYLEDCKLKQLQYNTIYYIGDGGNDFCPCSDLNKRDYVFARQGFTLQKKLAKEGTNACVITWDNGHQILSKLIKVCNDNSAI